MSPGLVPGDQLVAFKRIPPRRGALIFFRRPGVTDDFWLVKRVIGLPGEQVTIRDGRVIVDDRPLDEVWTTDPTRPNGVWPPVPPGHVFVLSDARARSTADSRTYGPIPLDGAYVHAIRYRRSRP